MLLPFKPPSWLHLKDTKMDHSWMCFSQTIVHGDHWWSIDSNFKSLEDSCKVANLCLVFTHSILVLRSLQCMLCQAHILCKLWHFSVSFLRIGLRTVKGWHDQQKDSILQIHVFRSFFRQRTLRHSIWETQLAGPHPWGWDSLFGSSAKCSQLPRHWVCTCAYT